MKFERTVKANLKRIRIHIRFLFWHCKPFKGHLFLVNISLDTAILYDSQLSVSQDTTQCIYLPGLDLLIDTTQSRLVIIGEK